jgi:phage/plasmid-associated DNA primase
MQKENTHLQKSRNQHQKQLRRHLWQVCEMELHRVHLDISMDACWIRKQEKNPANRHLPASGKKWRSRAWLSKPVKLKGEE